MVRLAHHPTNSRQPHGGQPRPYAILNTLCFPLPFAPKEHVNYTTPVGTRHQAPRAPTRKAHETHREENERFSGSEKNLKPSHSGEHSPVPRGAHHANRHETLWTRRKKGEQGDVPNCLTFSNRLTRLRPSHVPRKRRVDAPPSSLRRRPTPSPVVGEGWGEGARPPHEAKPPTPTRRIRDHTRTT